MKTVVIIDQRTGMVMDIVTVRDESEINFNDYRMDND